MCLTVGLNFAALVELRISCGLPLEASLSISMYNTPKGSHPPPQWMMPREFWQSSFLQVCWTPSRTTVVDLNRVPLGYYTDEAAFVKRVEEDATTFKPYGELIYSYSRPSPTKGKGKKGKSVANGGDAAEDDALYEVYHVSLLLPI